MDTAELANVVHAEQLDTPVLYGVGHRHNDAVVLEREGAEWKVFIADERGGMWESTLRTFDSEADAIEHVLLKLRGLKKSRRAMDALRARRAAQEE